MFLVVKVGDDIDAFTDGVLDGGSQIISHPGDETTPDGAKDSAIDDREWIGGDRGDGEDSVEEDTNEGTNDADGTKIVFDD